MRNRFASIASVGVILTSGATYGNEQSGANPPPAKGRAMTTSAKGTFDVKVAALPPDEKVAGVSVGRFSIDKVWHGDLEGTSKGEMTTVGTPIKGSAGYVAVEVFTGKLHGRAGSFTFLHRATMRQNADYRMSVDVLPDSATGGLEGLTGSLTIIIEGKNHSYVFDFVLPQGK